MSDEPAAIELTFKVKAGTGKPITVTVQDTLKVGELKTMLAAEDKANVPADRQRLVYSGRVLKDEDPLSAYKIQHNNTMHLVKSAASNATTQSSNNRAAAVPPVPLAAGTASDPLANLTGARYAGHISLPDASMFGADGGMGAPPSMDEMARLMSDPAMMRTMNTLLDSPGFIDQIIQMNPQLRNIPGVREILRSPATRALLSNPMFLQNSIRMEASRNFPGRSGGFPAPGDLQSPQSETAQGTQGTKAVRI